MASLELTTLVDRLDDDQLAELMSAYEATEAGPLDIDDVAEQAVLDNGIDDDVFVDFVDKLDANEASADIYLPSDFEDVFEAGDLRVGSSHALLLVLENLREDFNAEEEKELADEAEEADEAGESDFDYDEDEEEEVDEDFDEGSALQMKEELLRHIWKLMYQGAKASIRRGLCLFVRS